MGIINVVNRYTHKGPQENELDIDIGLETIFYNPFIQYGDQPQNYAIQQYEKYILDKLVLRDKDLHEHFTTIKQLVKKDYTINLVCSCTPNECHGTVIKTIINRWIQSESEN